MKRGQEGLGLVCAALCAVNGAFVPRQARAATLLAEGDKVEIVAPRQGG